MIDEPPGLMPSTSAVDSCSSTEGAAKLDGADSGWGIFFLPGGQALVLDGTSYRETLRRGTLLDLCDADAPSADEGSTVLEEHMRGLLADEATADVRLTVRGDG